MNISIFTHEMVVFLYRHLIPPDADYGGGGGRAGGLPRRDHFPGWSGAPHPVRRKGVPRPRCVGNPAGNKDPGELLNKIQTLINLPVDKKGQEHITNSGRFGSFTHVVISVPPGSRDFSITVHSFPRQRSRLVEGL